MKEELITVHSKLSKEEREELKRKAKYKMDTLCPRCGSELSYGLFKKGWRVKCTSCKFSEYPPIGTISEDITTEIINRMLEKVRAFKELLPASAREKVAEMINRSKQPKK